MIFITDLDNYINNIFLNLRTEALTDIFLFITNLADWLFTIPLLLILGGTLICQKKWRVAIYLWLTAAVALAISSLLKFLTNRPRPPIDLSIYPESYSSFTSNHSAVGLAVYGFCIYLLWESNLPKIFKIIISAILIILVILIGISRIYLGVHWLSDVIGGYIVGGAILGISILMLKNNKSYKK